MSNELIVINKTEYEFAYFADETGKRWYDLGRIAKSLGIKDVRHIAERIPKQHKRSVKKSDLQMQVIQTQEDFDSSSDDESKSQRGGAQSKWFVDDAGMYRTIIKSDSPKADAFTEWVTAEILPTIEKQGYYIDKKAVEASPEKVDALYDDASTLRATERNFFAKVKQYFTMATDYDPENKRMQAFFAVIQNRFLFAVTGHTAIEIVIDKIDHEKERCGMVQDVPVTKANLAISKNYLDQIDLQQLINLCNLYLHCLESIKIRDRKVTTEYLMSFFDQLLRDLQYQVMNGQDHPSCKQRDRIVQREFNLYKKIAIEDRQPQLRQR